MAGLSIMKKPFLMLMCFVLPCVLRSQDQQEAFLFDSTEVRPRISFGTDKFIDIVRFSANAEYVTENILGKFHIRQNYSGRAVQSGSTKFSDNENFILDYSYPLFSGLSVNARSQLLLNKDIGISNLQRMNTGAGLHYRPFDAFSALLIGGFEQNRQLDSTSYGPLTQFYANLKLLDIEDYRISGNGFLRYQSLDRGARINSDADASLSLERNFDEKNRLQINLGYRGFARNNLAIFSYSVPDTIMNGDSVRFGNRLISERITEQRSERRASVGSILDFSVFDPLMANISVSYAIYNTEIFFREPVQNNTRTSIKNSSDESQFFLSGALRYTGESIFQLAGLQFSSGGKFYFVDQFHPLSEIELREQQRSILISNNVQSETRLYTRTLWNMSERDTLQAELSSSIVRIDTPGSEIRSDRDILTLLGEIRFGRSVSAYLSAGLSAGIYSTHLVNISAANSRQNNWNHIIRLAPWLQFSSRYFTAFPRFEISANYTIFDFEKLTGIQSTSVRQASYRDSVIIPIIRNFWLESNLAFRVMQQGNFFASTFAETPFEDRYEQFAKILIFTSSGFASVGIGGRYYTLIRKNFLHYPDNISQYSKQFSFAPETSMRFVFPSGSVVQVSGWYEIQYLEGVMIRHLPNLSLQANLAL